MVVGAIYISAIIGTYNLISLGKYIYGHNKSIREQLKKLSAKIHGNDSLRILGIVIVIVIIISLPFGLLSPPAIQQTEHSTMNDIFELHPDGAASFLINVSRNLPPDSYILTENSLMPYFSDHFNIYSTPWSPGYENVISKFAYIVIQNNSFWANIGGNYSLQSIVNNGSVNGNYTVIYSYTPAHIMVLENKHNMSDYGENGC